MDGLDILSIDSILLEAPFKLIIYSVLIENKLKVYLGTSKNLLEESNWRPRVSNTRTVNLEE